MGSGNTPATRGSGISGETLSLALENNSATEGETGSAAGDEFVGEGVAVPPEFASGVAASVGTESGLGSGDAVLAGSGADGVSVAEVCGEVFFSEISADSCFPLAGLSN